MSRENFWNVNQERLGGQLAKILLFQNQIENTVLLSMCEVILEHECVHCVPAGMKDEFPLVNAVKLCLSTLLGLKTVPPGFCCPLNLKDLLASV